MDCLVARLPASAITLKFLCQWYGNKSLAAHSFDSSFMVSRSREKSATIKSQKVIDSPSSEEELDMPQDEVELWMYRQEEKRDARQKLDAEIRRREELDDIINKIADDVLGFEKCTVALTSDRPAGKAFVDDWECSESMMGIYEEGCAGNKLSMAGNTRLVC